MVWNHRVVRSESLEGEVLYGIHEAHYDSEKDAEAGNVAATTVHAVDVVAESVEGLRWVLEKMLASLDKPVLDGHELKAGPEGDGRGDISF